jgi:hypothetical protein
VLSFRMVAPITSLGWASGEVIRTSLHGAPWRPPISGLISRPVRSVQAPRIPLRREGLRERRHALCRTTYMGSERLRCTNPEQSGAPVAGMHRKALRRFAHIFEAKAAVAVVNQSLGFRKALFLRRLLTPELFRLCPGPRDHLCADGAAFRLVGIEKAR